VGGVIARPPRLCGGCPGPPRPPGGGGGGGAGVRCSVARAGSTQVRTRATPGVPQRSLRSPAEEAGEGQCKTLGRGAKLIVNRGGARGVSVGERWTWHTAADDDDACRPRVGEFSVDVEGWNPMRWVDEQFVRLHTRGA